MERAVFSVQELSKRWDLHPNTIRRMEEEGKLHRLPDIPSVRYSAKEITQLESIGKDAEELSPWERRRMQEEIKGLRQQVRELQNRLAKMVLIAQGGGT